MATRTCTCRYRMMICRLLLLVVNLQRFSVDKKIIDGGFHWLLNDAERSDGFRNLLFEAFIICRDPWRAFRRSSFHSSNAMSLVYTCSHHALQKYRMYSFSAAAIKTQSRVKIWVVLSSRVLPKVSKAYVSRCAQHERAGTYYTTTSRRIISFKKSSASCYCCYFCSRSHPSSHSDVFFSYSCVASSNIRDTSSYQGWSVPPRINSSCNSYKLFSSSPALIKYNQVPQGHRKKQRRWLGGYRVLPSCCRISSDTTGARVFFCFYRLVQTWRIPTETNKSKILFFGHFDGRRSRERVDGRK
jgi:hypothetical protein